MTLSPIRRLVPLFLTLAGLAPATLAHEREFTLSRDWFIPYPGELELELRNFFDTDHGDYSAQFEVEYGISKHFAIEPGIEIAKNEDDEYEIEGAELELRFNFGEFAYDRWLPALNVEYEHPSESDEADALEAKFVASRYREDGKDVSVNLNFGKEIEGEKESESELTAGFVMPFKEGVEDSAGWHYGPRAGVELLQDFEQGHTRIGPLFIYRPTKHLNFLTSYTFGVNDEDENPDILEIIVEWEF
jgi:hypothetical protein